VVRLALLILVAALGTLALPAVAAAGVSTGDGVWIWQNPLPQGNGLCDASLVDSQNGWAVGPSGSIIHTADGGLTWEGQNAHTSADFSAVTFTDAQHGWAVAYNADLIMQNDIQVVAPSIVATTDGGQHWQPQSTGITDIQDSLNVSLWDVAFTDSLHGWAVGELYQYTPKPAGYHALMLRTDDGGRTWTRAGVSEYGSLKAVCFADADHGWAVGSLGATGCILATSDGGATWKKQAAGQIPNAVVSVSFPDDLHGWAVTQSGLVEHTDDGGASWAPYRRTEFTTMKLVRFADAQNGWMTTSSGSVFTTHDGGESWTPQSVDGAAAALGIASCDATHAWLVGDIATAYVLATTDGGTTWTHPEWGVSADLKATAFVNAQTGWAVGASGTVLTTGDGGEYWLQQATPTLRTLRAVRFVDPLNGWAVGDAGTILHTMDGGQIWEQQSSPTQETLRSVSAVDALHAWAVGDGATILATADGGQTWAARESGLAHPGTFYAVSFVDATHGWIGGHATGPWMHDWFYTGVVLATSDGGATWQLQARGLYVDPTSICFIDRQHGWWVGATNCLSATTDGGATWNDQYPPWALNRTGADVYPSITFVDAKCGWAVGQGGVVVATCDGGATWYAENAGTARNLMGVSFVDPGHGWIVGDGGLILRDPGPLAKAYSARVRRGAVAVLRFRVADTSGVSIAGAIKIRKKVRSRILKVLRFSGRQPNVMLSVRFRCRLPRGSYRLFLRVTDSEGGVQAIPVSARLVVW
jgi:photosystem II stability/assembly factor-like uncharacterized protein